MMDCNEITDRLLPTTFEGDQSDFTVEIARLIVDEKACAVGHRSSQV